jgi:hypothetical protein
MRNLLIATAALSLIGGAAFAQNNASPNPTLNPSATGAVASGESQSQTDSTSGQVSTPTTSGQAGASTMSGAMTPDTTAPASAGASSTDASTASSTTASNAPSSAPESYPVCTSKHEDRCVNRAQATRSAKLATRHQKTDNVQPSGM